ncbi:MAG: hypothetical protein K2J08_03175 [Ruminococcus sp.]|nr:hypothetical protein [Ruminococcus sp.]
MFTFILFTVFCIAMIIHIGLIKESDHNPDGLISKADKLNFGISAVIAFICAFIVGGFDIEVFFTVLLIAIPFLWFPFCMTGLNIKHLVKGINSVYSDVMTILIGGVYHILLEGVTLNETAKNYTEAIYFDELHEMLNSDYSTIIDIVMFAGIIGLFTLCLKKPEKTPPLISAFSVAFSTLLLVLGALRYVQMIKHFEISHIMLYLYYFNLILITARRIRFHITEQVRLANERETVFRSRAGEKLHKIMSTISGMTKFSFILILPIVAVCEILYILLGQGADGFIKAFTMTADWTFSTQIPPPPLEYDGHYLCTVASGGHKKIVKPLRYGIRLNHKIIVNRQLLVANAFEDLIHELMPTAHRRIRNFYNKYGYPLSRHITTQTRADIVYILMKPLEYAFTVFLYMFDVSPENRIAVQYSEYKNIVHNTQIGSYRDGICTVNHAQKE